jgi:Protein of unknown function (DUF2924)
MSRNRRLVKARYRRTPRERWKAIYGKAPSREIGRSFLTRAIAYHLQERAYGGLKPSTRRLLAQVAAAHARISINSPENPKNRGLGGGEGRIRTPGTPRASMGGIRPKLGALFGPKKSIRAGENLFTWNSALFPALSGSLRSLG